VPEVREQRVQRRQAAGQPCSTDNSLQTTHDCLPDDNLFLAPLSVNLSPLTTARASDTDANGIFCSEVGQDNNPPGSAGCSRRERGRTIIEQARHTRDRSASRRSHDAGVGLLHPRAGNALVDAAANLPGPGATALSGEARLR
jgi:hypothetical protein